MLFPYIYIWYLLYLRPNKFNMNSINKLGFTDILKANTTFKSEKNIESKKELDRFIVSTRKEQEDVLRLKHLNDNQLKVIIKL